MEKKDDSERRGEKKERTRSAAAMQT